MEVQMQQIFWICCMALEFSMASVALADEPQDCEKLRGAGVGSTRTFPPYPVELKLFECAGLTQYVQELDILDHDMMIGRAKRLSIEELRNQKTGTVPPRKYSELTTALRLERFKKLVDTYYNP
jgi:hypothetical protein